VPVQAAEISVVALPNPIGIPEIILVIALLGFALWKRGWIRALLSICIIIYGVFYMPYDIKIAAPLVAVGTMLFIQAILTQIQQAREKAE
jgi:hypothetical protein